MTKNVIEEFDGYNDIIQDVEICRKYGVDYTLDKDSVDQYINRLHPRRLRLRVSDIIEETPSTKTLRLVSEDQYLPPFQAGQYIALLLEIGAIRTSRPFECGLDRTIYLFYGNKALDDAIFHDILHSISERFKNIHYVPVIEDPPDGYEGHAGLITGNLIAETLGDLADKSFYLCGPQEMYDFCIPELEKLGIPGKRIRKEVYGAPVNICDYPGWPQEVKAEDVFTVRVHGGGTLEAQAGEPLMVALEKRGTVVPSLCRSGECSMCRVKILSGKVFQPAGVPLRKSDRQFGYVHCCVSYPLEDLEVLI
jgi:ferredoxin